MKVLVRSDVLYAALLLAGALILFFWPAILGGEALTPADYIYQFDPVWRPLAPAGYTSAGNPLLADQVFAFYPWEVEVRRAFASGRLPLWTAAVNCGQPFLGNGQTVVLDPFHALARLFPLYAAFTVLAFTHLFFTGIFTYLFARDIGMSHWGGIMSMSAFTFSGPLIVWLGYPISGVIAWMPALLFCMERVIAGRLAYTWLCGLFIGAQFLAGHPETSAHALGLWLVYGGFRTFAHYGWRARRWLTVLARVVFSLAIGVMLAAVQLAPLFESLLHSDIFSARPTAALNASTLFGAWQQWLTLATIILPQFFGVPSDGSYWYPFNNMNEQTAYAGIMPLILAVWIVGVTLRRRTYSSQVVFWVGGALVSIAIAVRLPGFSMVSFLPGLNLVQHTRLRLIWVFAVTLLAGFGLDLLVTTARAKAQEMRTLLVIAGSLAAGTLLVLVASYIGLCLLRGQVIALGRAQVQAEQAGPFSLYPLDYYYGRVEARYAQMLHSFTPGNPVMYLPVILGIILVVALASCGRYRGAWAGTVLGSLALLLTMVDAFAVWFGYNPFIPPAQIFPKPSVVEFVQTDSSLYRIAGIDLALMPNSAMVFGLSDARGYDAVTPRRYRDLLVRINGAWKAPLYVLLRRAESPLLDLLNVKYVVSEHELSGRWELAFTDAYGLQVYRNRDVLPRAFIVYKAVYARGPEQSLEMIANPAFDFRTHVVLEGSAPDLAAAEAPSQIGQARIIQYEPERVVIETDTLTDGILVLIDTYAPGWQARVDTQPAEVYIADHAFRAVRIPAGRRRVEFVYAPPSFVIGSAISLAALACCALWAVVIIYRKARCEFSIT